MKTVTPFAALGHDMQKAAEYRGMNMPRFVGLVTDPTSAYSAETIGGLAGGKLGRAIGNQFGTLIGRQKGQGIAGSPGEWVGGGLGGVYGGYKGSREGRRIGGDLGKNIHAGISSIGDKLRSAPSLHEMVTGGIHQWPGMNGSRAPGQPGLFGGLSKTIGGLFDKFRQGFDTFRSTMTGQTPQPAAPAFPSRPAMGGMPNPGQLNPRPTGIFNQQPTIPQMGGISNTGPITPGVGGIYRARTPFPGGDARSGWLSM